MSAQPAGLKHRRPDSGLVGWATAWGELDRIDNDAQREALATIVRNLGVQGAPALKWAAMFARQRTGLATAKSPPDKLNAHVIAYIERRVREELAPFADKQLFPLIRP